MLTSNYQISACVTYEHLRFPLAIKTIRDRYRWKVKVVEMNFNLNCEGDFWAINKICAVQNEIEKNNLKKARRCVFFLNRTQCKAHIYHLPGKQSSLFLLQAYILSFKYSHLSYRLPSHREGRFSCNNAFHENVKFRASFSKKWLTYFRVVEMW